MNPTNQMNPMTSDPTPPGSEPFPPQLLQQLLAAVARRATPARTEHLDSSGQARFVNRLALETSPYLLQHAHNPVNWYAWGDEAFAAAERLGRPVFLSIGYSTCHWCHVMEAESFEDAEIAEFINRHYIAIKVDREERPDIDAVYMSAVQQLTGSGGWPMSVWLTAAREPFYAGTYFPPRDGVRGARRGFLSLLGELSATYQRDPARVGKACAALVQAVREHLQGEREPGAALPGRALIEATITHFKQSFDRVHGGLRHVPKFPSQLPLRLLLRHYQQSGDREALQMATLTLEKMAAGGLYDQLGGGFHRYSTDARWLVPHFEKMLYDNAQLVVAYAEAWQLTGRADFARVASETCDYVLREMTDAGGAFRSATDADSEGEEGRYFVWSEQEIRRQLASAGIDAETIALFLEHYDVSSGGNWEGQNILNVPVPDERVWGRLAAARARLYAVRSQRAAPLADDKILAGWNGLMISALAVAGRILGEPRYVAAAARAADFVLAHLCADGELLRSFRAGQARQAAFLDDHAFLAAGLIDLFEATFDLRRLEQALALAKASERLFADPAGGWFMASDLHERLIAREKPAYDGAEPSGTSIALMNALRLGLYTDDDAWRQIAERALSAHSRLLAERPYAMSEALLALDFHCDAPREIAIVWPDGAEEAAAPLLAVLRSNYLPTRALAAGSETALAALGGRIPFVRGKIAQSGLPTAYVCTHGRCQLPVSEVASFAAQLRGKG